MSKALTTLGVGPHAEYLAISQPLLRDYAERHGYTYIESPIVDPARPASWFKVFMVKTLLDYYDAVLWIDCDTVIVDPSEDLAAHVPSDAWQAITAHRAFRGTSIGEVPSCGVWLARKPMQPVLERLWTMTQYTNHPWWEQAGLHELLGYGPTSEDLTPVRRLIGTELYDNTHFLPNVWNSLEFENPHAFARIMHMPGVVPHEQRLAAMHFWVAKRNEMALEIA
jgi:hypothetical protein